MKTVIIGAGAMGSLFGGLLTEAGADVWLLDVWKEHVETLQKTGLSIEWEGCTRIIPVNATTDMQKPGKADLVIIFVKSLHTQDAADTAATLLTDDGIALTLQNGMGNGDILTEAIGGRQVLVGTTAHGATLLGPGCIRHAGKATTYIGMWSGDDSQPATRVADFFTHAAIQTKMVEEIRPIVWNKLLVNIGINSITALTSIKNGQLLDLPQTRALSATAVAEAAAVAEAQGIHVATNMVEQTFAIAKSTASNRSSMGQDVDALRPTEISAIKGFIVREAERLGIDAPVNRTLTTLIETLQAHY
ncbi:MAG: hypothetical protein BA873_12925 [Desulfobulbaceae bacterium C00003063]|nr:MAG: hypothetical protein BA873_12925 [Desulfobulbaceae bacterium C00003063]